MDVNNRAVRIKTDALGKPIYIQQPDPDYPQVDKSVQELPPTPAPDNTPTTLLTYHYDAANLLQTVTSLATISANATGTAAIDVNYSSSRTTRVTSNTAGQLLLSTVWSSDQSPPAGEPSGSQIDAGFVIQSRGRIACG